MDELPTTSLYIGGASCPSSSGATFAVHNPLTGRVVGHAAAATSADIERAIEAAHSAFAAWEHSPFAQREAIFRKASELLEGAKYRERVTAAMRDEVATMDAMLWFSVDYPAMVIRDALGVFHTLKGDTFPSSMAPGAQVVVQRRAKGVMLGMAPWNAPTLLAFRAVTMPILCGNTMVFKASEISPRTHAIVAEVFHEAGLPPGVLNFVAVDPKESPKAVADIIAHPFVRAIDFCGGDRIGRYIAAEAAKHLKPCVLELGGKCPAIVLNDADVSEAARAIVFGALLQTGQICYATTRVIVQRAASERLIADILERMKKLRAGDVRNDPKATLSALFKEGSAANIISVVKDAVDHGAKVLLGDMQRVGAIVQPHVLTDVRPGMRVWEEELFGPVLTISVVDTIDEAVELANASQYTLGSTLWTKDIGTGLGVAARVRSGLIVINGQGIHAEGLRGAGGLGGSSGYGNFDMDHFTDLRTIVISAPGHAPYPFVD